MRNISTQRRLDAPRIMHGFSRNYNIYANCALVKGLLQPVLSIDADQPATQKSVFPEVDLKLKVNLFA